MRNKLTILLETESVIDAQIIGEEMLKLGRQKLSYGEQEKTLFGKAEILWSLETAI